MATNVVASKYFREGKTAYQARDYVRALGGQLFVSSRPAVGTTFRIQLAISD